VKLSEFFTLEEMTITQVRSVGNVPNALKLENLTRTAMKMDHIRRLLGRPIIVSSGYRSPEVNKIVGGSPTSDHMQGLAVDFICPGFGTVDEIVEKIDKSGVEFDQLFNEFNRWVHIGFGPKMRRQVRRIEK